VPGVAAETLAAIGVPSSQLGNRLDYLCIDPRFRVLDGLESYFEGNQYNSLTYNWDGNIQGYGDVADIAPGWYIPIARRRPSTVMPLPRIIVTRLTAMLLGEDRAPEITVEGDPDAEDYVKALAKSSKLMASLQEARDRGGSCGTAVISFAFVEGRPRTQVHNAKNVHVLRWADRFEHRPAEVLEAWSYKKPVMEANGNWKDKVFYYARYWSEGEERVWDAVPEEMARQPNWATLVRSTDVQHGYGECPVYWCQNLPNSAQDDGRSDFEGCQPNFEAIDRLLSATVKGTIANVDPTLVIHDDPKTNEGKIKKGSEYAIYSKNGASYLELKGESIKVSFEEIHLLTQMCLDTAGVVIGDPDKIGTKAQSAAALKMLYMPMIQKCDRLRQQYGLFLDQILTGMLRAAKGIGQSTPGPVLVTDDGQKIQPKPVVLLPDRVEYEAVENDTHEGADGLTKAPKREKTVKMVKRTPGTSEEVVLKWPQYFKDTWTDVKQAVEATTAAQGRLIDDETAIKATANMFGITDIDRVQSLIDVEKEAKALQFPGPEQFDDEGGGAAFGGPPKKDNENDNEKQKGA